MGLTLELGKRGGAEATLVINYITKPSPAKAFYEVFILLPLRTYVIKNMILDTRTYVFSVMPVFNNRTVFLKFLMFTPHYYE
jgi:hypothetical protein